MRVFERPLGEPMDFWVNICALNAAINVEDVTTTGILLPMQRPCTWSCPKCMHARCVFTHAFSLYGAGVGTRDRGRGSLPLVKEVDYIVHTAWPQ